MLIDYSCHPVITVNYLLFDLEQIVIYNVGLLASEYYVVLGERDWNGFIRHTLYSLVLILSIAFVSTSFKIVLTEKLCECIVFGNF